MSPVLFVIKASAATGSFFLESRRVLPNLCPDRKTFFVENDRPPSFPGALDWRDFQGLEYGILPTCDERKP